MSGCIRPSWGILWRTPHNKVQRSSASWFSNFMEEKTGTSEAAWLVKVTWWVTRARMARSPGASAAKHYCASRELCCLWSHQWKDSTLVHSMSSRGSSWEEPTKLYKKQGRVLFKRNIFLKQRTFGKLNLQVTECGVVESAWTGVRAAGFCPGVTRNRLYGPRKVTYVRRTQIIDKMKLFQTCLMEQFLRFHMVETWIDLTPVTSLPSLSLHTLPKPIGLFLPTNTLSCFIQPQGLCICCLLCLELRQNISRFLSSFHFILNSNVIISERVFLAISLK